MIYRDLIDDVIRHQKIRVQLEVAVVSLENGIVELCMGTDEYNNPSEKHGLLVFRIVQLSTFESFCRLDHEEASLILSTKRDYSRDTVSVASIR